MFGVKKRMSRRSSHSLNLSSADSWTSSESVANSEVKSNQQKPTQPKEGKCFGCLQFCGLARNVQFQQMESIKLLLLGLDNSGKTTLALHLAGETVEDVVSTIGFSKFELELKQDNFRIVLYDLGGGKRIRSIWKNYYSLVHGIIFVIDSVDIERILEVKELLTEIVSSEKVSGKPILIFLNKQDIYEAMDEIDVCKFINLEEIVTKYQCITKIEPICAKSIVETGLIDSTIDSSFKWLVNYIDENWLELNKRVWEDSRQQISEENSSMRRRINKINKRDFFEVESQVPTQKVITEQPNSVDDVYGDSIEATGEEENKTLGPEVLIEPEKLLLKSSLKNSMLENSRTGSVDSGGVVSGEDQSKSESNSAERSSRKRLNKVYPSTG